MIVVLLAMLPHIMVVLTSLTATGAWYRSVLPQHLTTNHFVQALTDELAVPSVINSVKYATLATALAVLLGLGCAIIIVRSTLRSAGADRCRQHVAAGGAGIGDGVWISGHQRAI